MIIYKLNGLALEIVQGNIVKQPDLEAVVNAANAELKIGGGVAGAIHKAAGPKLRQETKKLAPIKPGEAVLTGSYNLPNEFIIHTLGPVYGKDKPEEKLLRACYQNSLKLAEENEIKSIGFPAISTGAFGYPLELAAEVSLAAVKSFSREAELLNRIRFVLFSQSDYESYQEIAKKIFKD